MKENQHIEWKESWRDEYLKWISGFANAEGGVLVIGKNDAGKVVGVADAERLLVDIPNKVLSILGIVVGIDLKSSGGKEYLEIKVDAHPYPVSYKGEYHIRSGSTKQELKGAALGRFLLQKLGRRWDGVPVPNVFLYDLDGKSLRRFRERAAKSGRLPAEILSEDDAHLIKRLHLDDGNYLKRAAVLLFHDDPERFATGASVKIGYFRADGELLFHDEVHGSLFSQVDKTLDLIFTKYFSASLNYEGVQRVEKYPVPEVAVREAVMNAIAHKDYASGVPIQIRVSENSLAIWNNGQLQEGWTAATLQGQHVSQPPNPDIASAFFRAGMIEAWGTGIEKMQRACADQGLPAPVLRAEPQGLWVEFTFAAPVKTPVKTPVKKTGKTPVETSVIASGKTSGKTSGKILAYLGRHPRATIPDLAKLLGITERSVERNLQKLQQESLLRRVGAAKGGYWEVIK